ncbi:MAG TPA: hypothetical protein VLM38_12305 [Blastocatellia bacterium]|nr:hypothetical protein [Blastocatellia bacterium]
MRTRKLLIILFAAVVAGNSLAAVAFALGEADCTAACCRPARQNKPRVTLTKNCCYSQCEDPGEAQPAKPGSVLTTQRDYKAGPSNDATLQAQFSSQSSRFLQSTGRRVIQSTRVYLRTGTLLI